MKTATPAKRSPNRYYFDWLSNKLRIQQQEQWYKVSKQSVVKHIGSGVLDKYYQRSVSKALSDVYPGTHSQ